jgi:signal transduction histidine kinase
MPAVADGISLSPLAEIHAMSRKEAATARPFKVRGIVTYAGANGSGSFVIEDDQAGVYVSVPEDVGCSFQLSPGLRVEVAGVTGPGGYAPVLVAASVEILGEGPLPTAQPVTVSQLLTGRFDCRRIEVGGVVQHAALNETGKELEIEIAGEFGRVIAFARDAGGTSAADWIDAEIVARGVCFQFFNERSQVTGLRIEMNSAREIEFKTPPPADPFTAPLVELDAVQAYSPRGANFHRQRIRGTVTLHSPDGFLYLQQGTHGVRVNLADPARFAPGDVVEAVGFSEARTRFVEWQRALVRKVGDATVPEAVPVTHNEVLRLLRPGDNRATGDFDGRLVSMEGTLEQIEIMENEGLLLFLASQGHIVTARIESPGDGWPADSLRSGSLVRLTGVCVVEYARDWPLLRPVRPVDMKLLLRSPDDVALIKAASWWTPLRLRTALGVTAALVLAGLPWIAMLRHKVRQRTADLANETEARREDEIEFRATLRERERVAADMHDTVEQALTGVSYQLKVADRLHEDQPARSRQHLQLATQLLGQSREDVRRSVWNLRARALDGRPLSEALRDVAAGLAARHSVDIPVESGGAEPDLPDRIAGQLLLLAQEAITNAIKHAEPSRIRIALEFTDTRIDLGITDDGHGFDPANAPGMAEGHLGLQGMRERIKRLGGRLEIESRPGDGTRIHASVPQEG